MLKKLITSSWKSYCAILLKRLILRQPRLFGLTCLYSSHFFRNVKKDQELSGTTCVSSMSGTLRWKSFRNLIRAQIPRSPISRKQFNPINTCSRLKQSKNGSQTLQILWFQLSLRSVIITERSSTNVMTSCWTAWLRRLQEISFPKALTRCVDLRVLCFQVVKSRESQSLVLSLRSPKSWSSTRLQAL